MPGEGRAARKAANDKLREARRQLEEFGEQQIKIHGKGNVPESPEYHRLNQAVIDAEPAASWWLRAFGYWEAR